MPLRLLRAAFAGWGSGRIAAFFLCLASMPIWLVSQGAGRRVFGALGTVSEGVSPLLTASLAAMFTALAMLFVCLVKTAHARTGAPVLRAGAAAYAAGYVGIAVAVWLPSPPPYFAEVASVLLGAGAAVLCLAWVLRVRWPDCGVALAGAFSTVLAGCAVGAVLVAMNDPKAAGTVLAVLGCLGAAGSVAALAAPKAGGAVGASRGQGGNHPSARSAAGPDTPAPSSQGAPSTMKPDPYEEPFNWWDVFGRLDVSMVSGGDEFATPVSRVLFFVVTPLLVLLLFLANAVGPSPSPDTWSPTLLVGTDLGVLLAVPLLFVRSARGLVNVSFRIYLPLVAFALLAACAIAVPDAWRAGAVHIGVGAFCSLYAVLLAALVLGMAGRSRALALPCASLLILVFNLTVLLALSPVETLLGDRVHDVLLFVLVVGIVALLMTMPSTQMWATIMDMLPTAPAAPAAVPLEDRCRALACACGLTEREGQILPYLARGHGSAHIAEELGVSESTVRSHRTNIYRKLGVMSREELISLVEAPPADGEDAEGPAPDGTVASGPATAPGVARV